MKTNTQHFDKLVSKALDLTITEIEANQLSALLDQNPTLQSRYCKTILLESLFHWEENENIDCLEPKIIHFPLLNYAFSLAAVFVCLFSAWFQQNYNEIVQQLTYQKKFKCLLKQQILFQNNDFAI